MTPAAMVIEFLDGLDKQSALSTPELHPEEVLLKLNQAQEFLVISRYTGINPSGTSVEETQKRKDDLRTLYKQSLIEPGSTKVVKGSDYGPYTVYELRLAELDDRYLFMLRLAAQVEHPTAYNQELKASKIVGVKIRQQDDLNEILDDTFARPARDEVLAVYVDNKVLLYVHSSEVKKVDVVYLVKPREISLAVDGSGNFTSPCELPEHMHRAVVETAIALAMGKLYDNRFQVQQHVLQTVD
jgi:hypothetical protein